jgi:Flp pilus assembly protein TadG
MRGRRGSTLVESSVVLLLFLVILVGTLDAGQLLFFHQFLTDRARTGARYAVVHAYNATAIANVVAYADPAPEAGTSGLFGLTPAMVQVNHYDPGTTADRVVVKITGYQMRFLSPWLAGVFTAGPFQAVAPVESAGTAQ